MTFINKLREAFGPTRDGTIRYSCGHSRPATVADGDIRMRGQVDAMCSACFDAWYQQKYELWDKVAQKMRKAAGLGSSGGGNNGGSGDGNGGADDVSGSSSAGSGDRP